MNEDQNRKLKLLGIRALADDLNSKLDGLVELTKESCGVVDDDSGWCGDYVYDKDVSIESLLNGTAKERDGGN